MCDLKLRPARQHASAEYPIGARDSGRRCGTGHRPRGRHPGALPLATGVLVSDPLDPAVLTGLPDNVCADAAQAPAAAVRVVGGAPVAVCFVADLTEGLWDVGIDTVPEAWRQRHGTAVFLALAGAMAEHGRQPVWAAYEDYPPSLAMAARLGFRPVARMAELTAPGPA